MRLGRILFLAIFLVAVTFIVGVSSFFEQQAYFSISELDLFDENGQFTLTTPKDDYKNEVLALLSQYGQKQISLTDLEQKLFELKVPSAYRDLHLALVGSVEELNEENPPVNEVKDRLEKLKDAYLWLTASLTIFIANIF